MTEIKGITHFHSETGTEGGYWAVQDVEYITKIPPEYGVWSGMTVFDPADPTREGKALQTWGADGRAFPDPMNLDPDYAISSLFMGQKQGDRDADARLQNRWGFVMTYNEDKPGYISGGTPKTEPRRPYGAGLATAMVALVKWEAAGQATMYRADELLVERWSYEGLHVLHDGDHLTIYNPPDPTALGDTPESVRWEGEIKLTDRGLFKAHYNNLWIHADQEGLTREQWGAMFVPGGLPCLLRTAP